MRALPTMSPGRRRQVLAFVGAWLFATVWGSLVQTQFNLQALAALDVEIPPAERWQTTAQDLLGFGPLYAALVLAAWLPAFGLAAWLARRLPGGRTALLALAAALGLAVLIRTIDALAPMPVFIDATRSLPGLLSMLAGAVLAGAGFARATRPTAALSPR